MLGVNGFWLLPFTPLFMSRYDKDLTRKHLQAHTASPHHPHWVRAPLAGITCDVGLFHLEGAVRAAIWETRSTMLNAGTIPLDFTRQATLDRLEFLAWFTDSAIRIPGTSRTIGADGLLSLIPGIGSMMGTGLSLYVIAEAVRLGVPAHLLARMATNIAADTLIGAVPVLGFVFDFAFKANQRNLSLLRQHLKETA